MRRNLHSPGGLEFRDTTLLSPWPRDEPPLPALAEFHQAKDNHQIRLHLPQIRLHLPQMRLH